MGAYIPKYFQPYELAPESVYDHFNVGGDEISLNFWNLFDPRMLITADRIREYYGRKMVVNTWWWGGETQYRGFRPPGIDVGARWSQHKFGRALDSIIIGLDIEDVIKEILGSPFAYPFQYITALELDVQWLHFDTRNWNKSENGIFTFSQ